MKLHISSVLISCIILMFPKLVNAQVCPSGETVAPSEETKTYFNNTYNISFQVPANYRTALFGSKSIINVIDPVGYETTMCQLRRKEQTDNFPPEITVRFDAFNSNNLLDATQKKYYINKLLQPTNIAGQRALVYLSLFSGNEMLNISFHDSKQKYLITISAFIGNNNEILMEDTLKLIAATFKFNN